MARYVSRRCLRRCALGVIHRNRTIYDPGRACLDTAVRKYRLMVHRLCRVLRQAGALCAVTMIVTAAWPLAVEAHSQPPEMPAIQGNTSAEPLASRGITTSELIDEMQAVVVR